ncbi:MAG: 3-deoxy-7-phosphoheptulonate synthase [Chloroflexi bacterium]|nr:3-deoxy-7-phosphoheptulonate synthase [Chloroflexota bacterium]|tara:strand:- start:4454 stop:5503 length:1050 start_codon:yes stop_codon:yes gene_type:complete
MNKELRDINIVKIQNLPTPAEYESSIPISETQRSFIFKGRQSIIDILSGQDDRLLAIVGPCSIHDVTAGIEYAKKLKKCSEKIASEILVLMRVYFEKPRTTIGWKGMIYDPHLNGSLDIEEGLKRARSFLSDLSDVGLLCATEFVDPITPQYIADFVSWAAIGARTAESQTHRQMASGLSMPVGIKNGTGGSIQLAADAIVAANSKHGFLGVDEHGNASIVMTNGNPNSHLVLRGGSNGPNYDETSVANAINILNKSHVSNKLIIDCSHANSNKNFELEPLVFQDVLNQRLTGNSNIAGMMIESHLKPGSQTLNENKPKDLEYGVSITDSCLGWEQTEELLLDAFEKLS